MSPIRVDVITPLPEGWGLCVTCEAFMAQADLERPPHERTLESFPPDWHKDFLKLSDLIQIIAKRYENQVIIRLYDPRSLQGLVKAIRYGVRQYPTFIVEGRKKVVGLEQEPLERAIQDNQPRAGA